MFSPDVVSKNSPPYGVDVSPMQYNSINQLTKGQTMTLEEFKAYVEMRQKISLEEALSRLKPKGE